MLHPGTFSTHGPISTFWQASKLASHKLAGHLRRHLLVILFIPLLFIMLSRVSSNPRAVIWSDAEGYYQYLPALFILKDFHQVPHGSVWPYYNDKGEYVIKYSCGIALFEWPFFLLARFVSPNFGYAAADYFNPVYCNAMAISGLLFAFFGLLLLRKALLRYFRPIVVLWVVLAVFLGTNLFHYATKEMSVSHSYSFFLFSLLLYLLPAWLEKPDRSRSFVIGLVMGWIILVRPTNIIFGLMFILYDVYSIQTLKERFQFLWKNVSSILWMVPGIALMLSPQLLYWKEMTGHWIYYSYTNEGFKFWNQPKIASVLFDVQNGLFLYSPMALLMILGAFYGYRVKQFQGTGVLLIFALTTYVFASWWAWWFGGAFGHRCYVEYYALLAFPLAGLFQWIYQHARPWIKYGFFAFVLVLMVYSVRMSYLYTSIGGPWDGEDWRWNWDKYEWIMTQFIP